MRKILSAVLCIIVLPALFVVSVRASSSQAYQDYQYQFDQYRQKLSDFKVAYGQYQQFHSLTAQQDSLGKVTLLLAQRNQVAKTYFLFLNEKLNEDPGLGSADSAGYRTQITNEMSFLDQNTTQSSSISSLADAATVSNLFVKNYNAMQNSYRQTIMGLELGYLTYFGSKFDAAAAQAQALITASHDADSPEKQAVLDRWLVSLSNQHSLFEQHMTLIRTAMTKVTGDVQEQDREFTSVQTLVNSARQDLVDGTSYLGEVETAIQYE